MMKQSSIFGPSRSIPCVAGGILLLLGAGRSAMAQAYDFAPVVALAQGAVAGQNVSNPVPGFELLFLKNGRVVYQGAFGNWSIGRVANADSATKTISGSVIMSLTESASTPFSLDSRLSQFIPQFDGAMQTITIRQCFSHTAGFGSSTAISNGQITLQQAALDISDDTLAFPSGTTFSYGGVSMHAAGAAAEIAGGANWDSLFATRIATPLGLTQTHFVLTSPSNPRIAGGCESTATEFGRVMEMLRLGGVYNGTRVLSEASVATMLTRQTPVGVPVANSPLNGSSDYGVGIWLDQRSAQGVLTGALAAGARGFSAWIDFDDGMVGVFATDLTTSGNILPLLYLIRDSAQQVIRNPLTCRADYNGVAGINTQDIFDYLAAWFLGSAAADFNGVGGVSVQDIFDFLAAWFAGC